MTSQFPDPFFLFSALFPHSLFYRHIIVVLLSPSFFLSLLSLLLSTATLFRYSRASLARAIFRVFLLERRVSFIVILPWSWRRMFPVGSNKTDLFTLRYLSSMLPLISWYGTRLESLVTSYLEYRWADWSTSFVSFAFISIFYMLSVISSNITYMVFTDRSCYLNVLTSICKFYIFFSVEFCCVFPHHVIVIQWNFVYTKFISTDEILMASGYMNFSSTPYLNHRRALIHL